MVAAPVPKDRKQVIIDLTGTTWQGDGVVAPTEYRFEPNGVMSYSYNGKEYGRATWKQTKGQLYWETNNKYCEFEGTISGNRISGRAWNVTKKSWDLTFQLKDK